MTTPRILVAEDEFIIALDLCNTVEEAGFVVEGPYPNLTSAMLAVQKDVPDLAILDVQLDDGDSFALAEKLRQENVPIIFHSGRMTTDEMHEAFPEAQAVAKPCPPSTMLETVQHALEDRLVAA